MGWLILVFVALLGCETLNYSGFCYFFFSQALSEVLTNFFMCPV